MMSAMLRMNAVRVHQFGGPEVLRLEPGIPVPPITETQVRFKVTFHLNPLIMKPLPKVLVRVMYAGVNPVETYIREGQYSRLPDLPFVPGCDAAGYVERLGVAVQGLKVWKDLTFCDGHQF